MPRYVAFLRAINVGGHVVSMAALEQAFLRIGLANVETFIASGNVIFESAKREKALVPLIEAELRRALGYEVATFLRTAAEVAAVASSAPFSQASMDGAGALVVGFLTSPLDAAERRTLSALETEVDTFAVDGREVYWRCAVKQSESKFSNAVFERKVGRSTTFRGLNTVRKLAAKYCRTVAG